MFILFTSHFSGCLPACLSAIYHHPQTLGQELQDLVQNLSWLTYCFWKASSHPLPLQHLPSLVTRYLHNQIGLHQDHLTSHTHGSHTLAWNPGGIILQGRQVHTQPDIVCLVISGYGKCLCSKSCCFMLTFGRYQALVFFGGTFLFQFSLLLSITSESCPYRSLESMGLINGKQITHFRLNQCLRGMALGWKGLCILQYPYLNVCISQNPYFELLTPTVMVLGQGSLLVGDQVMKTEP